MNEQNKGKFNKFKVKLILIMHTIITLIETVSYQTLIFIKENITNFDNFIRSVNSQAVLNWWRVQPNTSSKITISSRQSSGEEPSTYTKQYSSTFFAILHQIIKHDPIAAKILELNYIRLTDHEYHIDQCNCDECKLAQEARNGRDERIKRSMMILRQRNPFKMAKNIECIIR